MSNKRQRNKQRRLAKLLTLRAEHQEKMTRRFASYGNGLLSMALKHSKSVLSHVEVDAENLLGRGVIEADE